MIEADTYAPLFHRVPLGMQPVELAQTLDRLRGVMESLPDQHSYLTTLGTPAYITAEDRSRYITEARRTNTTLWLEYRALYSAVREKLAQYCRLNIVTNQCSSQRMLPFQDFISYAMLRGNLIQVAFPM
jgi:hypothetical protein